MSKAAPEEVMHYDLNIRYADVTVRITLAYDTDRIVRDVEIGGNVQGFDLFDCAIEQLYDDIRTECEDADNAFGVHLKFENAEEENFVEEGYDQSTGTDWLKPMIIAMEIIKYEEEKPR